MGIYDRDYNRVESSEEGHMTTGLLGGLTPVVKWLLIINFAVFVINALAVPRIGAKGTVTVLDLYGSVFPDSLLYAIQLWRLVTYQFLHASVGHLVFNMLVLYFMGPLVERTWGSRAFIKFYLFCGACGGVVYTALTLMHVMPAGIMRGASGAIYGVMAAVAYMFPRLCVLLWGIIPMTMARLAILLVIISFLMIAFGKNVGGELAHLTGLGVGFLYMLYKPWMTELRMRHGKGAWARKVDQERQFLRQVDDVLDKVHREGISSLTPHERHILQEATRREQQNAQK